MNTIGLGKHKVPKKKGFLLQRLSHDLSHSPPPWAAHPYGSTQLPPQPTSQRLHDVFTTLLEEQWGIQSRPPALFWVLFGSIYQHFKYACLKAQQFQHLQICLQKSWQKYTNMHKDGHWSNVSHSKKLESSEIVY